MRSRCEPPVCGLLRLENVQEAVATTDVDAMPLHIHENVIGILAGWCACTPCSIGERKGPQNRWVPKHDDNLPRRVIEGPADVSAPCARAMADLRSSRS